MVQANSPPAINNVHSLLARAQNMESPLWASGTRGGFQEGSEALNRAMLMEDHICLVDPLVIDYKCLP